VGSNFIEWVNQFKELSPLFSLLTVITAILGAIFGIRKFAEEGRRQRQMTADKMYNAYLLRASQLPELCPDIGQIPTDPQGAYPWLVAIILNAISAQIEAGALDGESVTKAIKFDL
jgi:hypothetical protein